MSHLLWTVVRDLWPSAPAHSDCTCKCVFEQSAVGASGRQSQTLAAIERLLQTSGPVPSQAPVECLPVSDCPACERFVVSISFCLLLAFVSFGQLVSRLPYTVCHIMLCLRDHHELQKRQSRVDS